VITYETFLAEVEQQAQASREEAERAVRATLQTLAERISAGQAEDLARQLPPEVRPLLEGDGEGEPFTLAEFLRRVAEREGADLATAEQHAAAVFAALGLAVTREELEDMSSELPKDFAPLVDAAQAPPPPREQPQPAVAAGEFEGRVARHGGIDRDAAHRATAAVLETLAERITHGEVEDVEARLPAELHPPLQRGDALSNGAARPLSLKQFVLRVAEREGVTPDTAHEHARAVFLTLREVVGEKEFSDVDAQLPDEYAALLARH
jgi:uncharacterized protein (DUF2267 family)